MPRRLQLDIAVILAIAELTKRINAKNVSRLLRL